MSTIAIDLGTTHSCVGVFRKGKLEMIPNERGNFITPSVVAFKDMLRQIGDAAEKQIGRNPVNTVMNIKRMIGLRSTELSKEEKIEKHRLFNVVLEREKPRIEVDFKGEKTLFTAEEITAMILRKMKNDAERYLGEKEVGNVNISVPAKFNYSQRQATRNAALIAGFKDIKLVSEPTAAAVAYYHSKPTGTFQSARNILVFDLGGGTLDVSVLTIHDSIITVKSSAGNTHLGGVDFDNRMLDDLIDEFNKVKKKNMSENKRAIGRLRRACERAKRTLSYHEEAHLRIDTLFDWVDFDTCITRKRFEELNEDLFCRTMTYVRKALTDAKMKVNNIDDIILVGGSTRIPKIRELLLVEFRDKKSNTSINPDLAVITGAAILNAHKTPPTVYDVVPVSLGVESPEGQLKGMIIRNNSELEKKERLQIFTTLDGTGDKASMHIYEGNSAYVTENHLFDAFQLSMDKTSGIKINFQIDESGILTVSPVKAIDERGNPTVPPAKAIDESGNSTVSPVKAIESDGIRLDETRIKEMKVEVDKCEKDDEENQGRIEAKSKLENRAYELKRTATKNKTDTKYCDDVITWLYNNQSAEKDEYDYRLEELKKKSKEFLSGVTQI